MMICCSSNICWKQVWCFNVFVKNMMMMIHLLFLETWWIES